MRRSTILEFLNNLTSIKGKKTQIRHRKIQDAIEEYNWRRDSELCRLDASVPITGTFQEYLHWYANEHSFSNNSCILAIDNFDGKHIGNFGCFNIDDIGKELEIGIMIGEKKLWSNGYGEDVIKTMVNALFHHTHTERIFLKTLDWNIRAQKCFQKCGFTFCGKLNRGEYNFIMMEIKRPQIQTDSA